MFSLTTQEYANIPISNFLATPSSDPLNCSAMLPESKYAKINTLHLLGFLEEGLLSE